jgi:hypothetical protein
MKLSLIAAGAALFGLAAFAAPASALPVSGLHNAAPAHVQEVQWRRHKHWHRHRDCHWRKVVRRDRFGIRRVKTVRVCRR